MKNKTFIFIEFACFALVFVLLLLFDFPFVNDLSSIAVFFVIGWVLLGLSLYFLLRHQLPYKLLLYIFLHSFILFYEINSRMSHEIGLTLFFFTSFALFGVNSIRIFSILAGFNLVHFLIHQFVFVTELSWFIRASELIVFIALSILVPLSHSFILKRSLEQQEENGSLHKELDMMEKVIKELLMKLKTPSFIVDESGSLLFFNNHYEHWITDFVICDDHSQSVPWKYLLPQYESGEDISKLMESISHGKNSQYTYALNGSDEKKYWIHFESIGNAPYYICRVFSPKKNAGLSSIQNINKVLLEYIRSHDEVSGLRNRGSMVSILNNISLNKSKQVSSSYFFALKIENARDIISEFGIKRFNKLIRFLANSIVGIIKSSDTVGRLNEDTFGIIFNNVLPNSIHKIITRTLESLVHREGYPDQMKIPLNLFSSCMEIEFQQGEKLLQKIEKMISYCSKMKVTETLFYSESIEKAIELDINCKEIIQKQDLYLIMQPQYRNGAITGIELLSRLNHNIQLTAFFESVQRQDLNDQLDWIIFDKAETVIKELIKQRALPSEVSINMIPTSIENDKLIEKVITLLSPYTNQTHLIIEITEAILQHDAALTNVKKLKDADFCIAIDDFGTGFSSMERLVKLDVNIVKIDRSLVKDILVSEKQLVFLNSLVDFLFENELEVVIEGIDSEEQYNLIRNKDALKFQGFHFSKPIPMSAFVSSFAAMKNPL